MAGYCVFILRVILSPTIQLSNRPPVQLLDLRPQTSD